MNRDRVEAQLRNLERLLPDRPPLLSLVILDDGAVVMVAHPMLKVAEQSPELCEVALRLLRVRLVEISVHFEQLIQQTIRADVPGAVAVRKG
jgi:predicted ArsR family transcriptional regulator